jgi:hypothetical protein
MEIKKGHRRIMNRSGWSERGARPKGAWHPDGRAGCLGSFSAKTVRDMVVLLVGRSTGQIGVLATFETASIRRPQV